MRDLIAPVETKTGGTVVGMEYDDEETGNGTLVEVDVKMSDGSEKAYMVNTDSKAITAQNEVKDTGDGETNDDS